MDKAPSSPTVLSNTSAANLVSLITTAYAKACQALDGLTGDQFKRTSNLLFWGGRIGSKVEGVRKQNDVDTMLRRSIMSSGLIAGVQHDAEGNNIYVFRLSPQYQGKGKTTYARIGDVVEKGPMFRALVGVGSDFNEETGDEPVRPQAPEVRSVSSNIITVVLSADNLTFVRWFCGEPKKVYTESNWRELLDADGELDLRKAWMWLDTDFNQRTHEKKRRLNNERYRNERERNETTAPHPEHPRLVSPLASVGDVMQAQLQHFQVAEANADQEVETQILAPAAVAAVDQVPAVS